MMDDPRNFLSKVHCLWDTLHLAMITAAGGGGGGSLCDSLLHDKWAEGP